MPKQIRFEGQLHSFPDDFTDADIQQALGSLSAQPSPKPSAAPSDLSGPREGPPKPPLPQGLGGPRPALDPNASWLSNYARGVDINELTPGGVVGKVAEMPRHGLGQIAAGAEQIAGADLPPARGEKPVSPGRARAGGTSKIIRGTGEAVAPVALPAAAIAAPIPTAIALGTGALAGYGAEKAASAAGLAPEYSALLGDVANIVAGGLGPKAAGGLLSRMKVSPSGPVAELVKFADEHGIPLSAAARSGIERIRQWQARTATSKTAQRSQAATQGGLTRTAEELRGPQPQAPEAGPPKTREGAARGVVQELRTRKAEHARGESAAYTQLEEIEAANQEEVTTGTKRIDTGLFDERGRPITREERLTEKIGLPVNLKPAKGRLRPLVATIEQQLPPALREQSVGLQGLRNLVDAPDTVSATVADGYLSAVKTLLREGINPKSRRLLRAALDEVSPAVDQAVERAGPEAVKALAEGRSLTRAKYAVERTMRLLRVPKEEEFPLEPLRLFRKLTAPGDVNIGILERVRTQVPDSIPAVGRAVLEGLFDTALGRDGKLDPAAALKAWGRVGDATKKILFKPEQVTELNQFFRQNARFDLLEGMFDSALGRQGKLDPAGALRKWNALDDGTKRNLFEPKEITELGRFFRLAELEAKTPRAVAAEPASRVTALLARLGEAVVPEVAGLLFHHEPWGRAAGTTWLALRSLRAGGKATTRALSRALWDPETARMLTEGIQVPTRSVPAGAAAAAGMRGTLSPSPPPARRRPAVRGASLVPSLAEVIKRREGWKAGSVSQRNNNPGNLKPLPNQSLPGMIGRDDQGFAIFRNYDAGWNALVNQVQRNVDRGLNLNQFFAGSGSYPGYAPSRDRNQPFQYAAFVGSQLGIDPRTPLSSLR